MEKDSKVFTKSRSDDSFWILLLNMEDWKKQTIQAVHGSRSFIRYVIDFLRSHKNMSTNGIRSVFKSVMKQLLQ